MSIPPPVPGFRPVPYTGVIFVMAEAARHGWRQGHPEWCNLGQGQPETGPLPDAPQRVSAVPIAVDDQEYAPVAGIAELREAVAELYNARYRQGKRSQYSAENVCICGGGRASLTRAVAALGSMNLGHFLPDYTAYEELLDLFKLFSSIPILRHPTDGYAFGTDALRREVLGRGLTALLLSNPCNPTGAVIRGAELAAWVAAARELQCTLMIDEFYAHYLWTGNGSEPHALTVSAAEFVEDVDRDPVVLFDGFTKNWRYPGWRTSWIVGPRPVIEAAASTGSFLDGGGSRPLQRAALPLLSLDYVRAEAAATQKAFRKKRALMLEALAVMGVPINPQPEGTFYCWADLSSLPGGLDDGMTFFRRALEHKVICVPGEFFDVNPGKRRSGRPSRFRQYVRLSFGPEESVVAEGMGRLVDLVKASP